MTHFWILLIDLRTKTTTLRRNMLLIAIKSVSTAPINLVNVLTWLSDTCNRLCAEKATVNSSLFLREPSRYDPEIRVYIQGARAMATPCAYRPNVYNASCCKQWNVSRRTVDCIDKLTTLTLAIPWHHTWFSKFFNATANQSICQICLQDWCADVVVGRWLISSVQVSQISVRDKPLFKRTNQIRMVPRWWSLGRLKCLLSAFITDRMAVCVHPSEWAIFEPLVTQTACIWDVHFDLEDVSTLGYKLVNVLLNLLVCFQVPQCEFQILLFHPINGG